MQNVSDKSGQKCTLIGNIYISSPNLNITSVAKKYKGIVHSIEIKKYTILSRKLIAHIADGSSQILQSKIISPSSILVQIAVVTSQPISRTQFAHNMFCRTNNSF